MTVLVIQRSLKYNVGQSFVQHNCELLSRDTIPIILYLGTISRKISPGKIKHLRQIKNKKIRCRKH